MTTSMLLERVGYIIGMGEDAIKSHIPADSYNEARAHKQDYIGFKGASLSFISSLYGEHSSYYKLFDESVWHENIHIILSGLNLLKAIRHEIENGYLVSVRQLITADIFADFLEMSEHLLEGHYKDAAAVMIGSTLEEHLRQLCDTYKVDKTTRKGTDDVHKKADILNADLKKAGAYNAIDQKQVTAWLGIRNSAAHGKYEEYTEAQVKTMYDGVFNFIARVR